MTIKYTQKNKQKKQNSIKKTVKKNGGGLFNWWNRRKALQSRQKELEQLENKKKITRELDDVFSDTNTQYESTEDILSNLSPNVHASPKNLFQQVNNLVDQNLKTNSKFFMHRINNIKKELNVLIYGQRNPFIQSLESLKHDVDSIPSRILFSENRLQREKLEWNKKREEHRNNRDSEKEKLTFLTQQLTQSESTLTVDNLEEEENMRLSNDSNSSDENDKIKVDILQTESNISVLDNSIQQGDQILVNEEQKLEKLYREKDLLEQQYNERLDEILEKQKMIEEIKLQIRRIPRTQRNWRHWFTGGKHTKKRQRKYKRKTNKKLNCR